MTPSIEGDRPEPALIIDELEPAEFVELLTHSPEAMEQFISDASVDRMVRAARPWGMQTVEESPTVGSPVAEPDNAQN